MENGKIDALRVWLHDHNITFLEQHEIGGVNLDLWIPVYRVGISTNTANADVIYPKLTANHIRTFWVRETETGKDVVAKIVNCIKDIRYKRATRYCWKHFTPEQKRNYKGIWPMNFARFKKAFGVVLAEAENDLDVAVNVFIKDTPKEKWL